VACTVGANLSKGHTFSIILIKFFILAGLVKYFHHSWYGGRFMYFMLLSSAVLPTACQMIIKPPADNGWYIQLFILKQIFFCGIFLSI
jgi:hypothetical protein